MNKKELLSEQKAVKQLKDEINSLKRKLALAQRSIQIAKLDKESLKTLISEREFEHQKDIDILKNLYLTERHLWRQEMREQRFKLKSKKLQKTIKTRGATQS